MLSESKLQACSPLPLYLSSFEIMLNVMLDLRRKRGAFLNFTQPTCLSETEETSNIKARQELSQSSCWLFLESLQEIADECAGWQPAFQAAFVFFFGVVFVLFVFFKHFNV